METSQPKTLEQILGIQYVSERPQPNKILYPLGFLYEETSPSSQEITDVELQATITINDNNTYHLDVGYYHIKQDIYMTKEQYQWISLEELTTKVSKLYCTY